MRRLPILAVIMVLLSSLMLVAVPAVSACQSCSACRRVIQVVPVDSKKTGEPIVTGNPANLMIFHTGKGPIKNVWLLIVINEPTYNALKNITINGTIFMTEDDFQQVTAQKIPPPPQNPATGYPGSLCQYNVNAIKDKMDEKDKPVYYAVKYFLSQITNSATTFTLRVNLNSSADLKALVLALGRYDFTRKCLCVTPKPFNACSSFSKSTFVIPEASTLALTSASLCGVAGFYLIRRRKNLE